MQIFGILVRTRHDHLTEIGFQYADEILRVSRERGHIFLDIAAEAVTRKNLWRILDGIGSPKGNFLKLVVFYCHGNARSPIDQAGEDFVSEDVITKFAGWGVYCIGCDVGQTLGRRLLDIGASFLIAFNSSVMVVLSHAAEIYEGLNVGIVRMLSEDVGAAAATDYMREFFVKTIDKIEDEPSGSALLRKMALRAHADSLEYHGPDILRDLKSIKPGQKEAVRLSTYRCKNAP